MQINTVNQFDYAIIALYLAIVLGIGFYATKKSRNSDQYFRAGGQMPWLLAGISNWASGFTAYMFVVAAGFAYKHGVSALLIFTSQIWGYLLCAYLFAPAWRRSRIKAPFEFLTRRYSYSTTWFYSLLNIIPSVFSIGSGLYVLCIFGSTALGLNNVTVQVGPFTLAGWQLFVLTLGTTLVLYSVAGGLWAAVISESLQSIIILVMVLIIFPVTFLYLGNGDGLVAGFQRLVREAPPGFLTEINGPPASPLFAISWIMATVIGMCTSIPLIQRYISVRDEGAARKMALVCALLAFIGPILWIMPALAAKVIFPDIAHTWAAFPEPEEASFVGLALTLLPHGMLGFVVSAILSATLGTDNAILNVLSSVITQDLYLPMRKKLGKPEPTDAHKVAFARLTILIIGLVGIGVALLVPKLGGAFKLVAFMSTVVVGLAMPFGLGLLYRKTPWWAAIATSSAFIMFIVISEIAGLGRGHEFVRNMLGTLLLCPAVFFVTRFWWDPADPRNAEILRLDHDLRTPLDPQVATAAETSAVGRVFSALGLLCLVFGSALVLCGLIVPSTPLVNSNINHIAAALLVTFGFLLYRYGRSAQAAS